MTHSAAERRGGRNKYLKWRSMKKEMMLYYAKGKERQAWLKLRKMMLLANRSFHEIQEDKKKVDVKDEYRI